MANEPSPSRASTFEPSWDRMRVYSVVMTDPTPIPLGSQILQDMLGTAAMRELWTEERMVESWMAVERAFTESQAELGLIPSDAAALIIDKLDLEHLTPAVIAEKRAVVGHLMVSFLQAFREVCGPAAEHVHLGLTTQDVLDTALVLQMREAHDLILEQAVTLERSLCEQALRYKDTTMMGRTHQQHAVPLTLGFVLAGWACEVSDHIDRAQESERRWQQGNISGAVGSLNALVELAGVEEALRLQKLTCARLDLSVPLIDLHSRSDRFIEVVSQLALLCGSLAKFGMDLAGLQRTEVMELEEPYDPDQHWSSTMPNKKNPEVSEQLVGLAALARGFAAAAQEMRVADKRDATRMPIEFTVIPQAYLVTAKALETATTSIRRLIVNADRMYENLDHPNMLGQAVAERIMIALYKKTGLKDRAHAILYRCSKQSRQTGARLETVLAADPEVRAHFDGAELVQLCDLTTYTGTASLQTVQVVRTLRLRRAQQRGVLAPDS